jgi:hypothetical protein
MNDADVALKFDLSPAHDIMARQYFGIAPISLANVRLILASPYTDNYTLARRV